MNNSKKTRNALVSSIIALMLCLSMFMGTTMAWFTDTATTSVNTIQAGTLDIDIVDETGDSLVGETLEFKDVNDNANILWEPGATFVLDSFKVVNKGNLAAKYKIVVNGITGDAKLLEAIDFTVKVGNEEKTFEELKGELAAKNDSASDETALVTISGTMKTSAGNEYQGLSLAGLSVTVVAGQDTVEVDSISNQYDLNAEYGKYSYATAGIEVKSSTNATTQKKEYFVANEVTLAADGATATVPADVKVNEGVETLSIHAEPVKEIELPTNTVVSTSEEASARTVEVSGVAEDNEEIITVVLDEENALPAGLVDVKAYNKGVELTKNPATGNEGFEYNPATGVVTLYVKHFCNFTFVYPRVLDNEFAYVTVSGPKTNQPYIDVDWSNFAQSKEAEDTIDLEFTYGFKAKQTMDQAVAADKADWNADFKLTLSRPMKAGEAYIAGQYNGWADEWGHMAQFLDEESDNCWVPLTADVEDIEQPIMLLQTFGGLAVTYGELIDYRDNYDTTFYCGGYATEELESDLTLSVDLVIYTGEGESYQEEVIGTYSYTFKNN